MASIYILGMIIQVGLIVHALKTGRPYYWVFVLLLFPGLGPLIYILVEVLPDLRRGRGLDGMREGLNNMIPGKRLATLEENLEITPTIENRRLLAQAYAQVARYDDAVALYQACLSGTYRDDTGLLFELASTFLEAGRDQETLETLDKLEGVKPGYKAGETGLLRARALQHLGDFAGALATYEEILPIFSGEEARCRYAQLLVEQDREAEARPIFAEIIRNVRRSPVYYRRAQKAWVSIAKKGA